MQKWGFEGKKGLGQWPSVAAKTLQMRSQWGTLYWAGWEHLSPNLNVAKRDKKHVFCLQVWREEQCITHEVFTQNLSPIKPENLTISLQEIQMIAKVLNDTTRKQISQIQKVRHSTKWMTFQYITFRKRDRALLKIKRISDIKQVETLAGPTFK